MEERHIVVELLSGSLACSGLSIIAVVGIGLLLLGKESVESNAAIEHDNNPISQGVHGSDVLIGIIVIVIVIAGMANGFASGAIK